jgi:Ca-activated chloride channel family protein
MLLQPSFQDAHAFGWKDLWLRSDQQAARALTNEQPSKVPGESSPAWRGSAAYRQQQHESAAELFGQLDSATAHYNRANALAKAGQLGRALEAYDQALSMQSDMEDAKFNRDLVNELLNQQQQQQNNQQQSNQDQDQDENSQQQEQREGGNGAGAQDDAENDSASAQRPENQTGQQAQDSERTNSQRAEETSQDDQQEQQSGSEQNAESGSNQTFADKDSQQMDESQQQLEQWLKQVPDDPGGLLRRKFRYQYSLRPQQAPEVQQW